MIPSRHDRLPTASNILVIGAGIAGLTAARALQGRGHRVTVLDKGRAPGGRVSTRRVVDEDADRPEFKRLSYDHGAQYFTVRDPRFDAEVQAWHKARIIQVWQGKLAAFDSEGREAVEDAYTRWVGVPGMSAIPRHLAQGLDVHCTVRVASLVRDRRDGAQGWFASADASGDGLGPFDAVVVAVPATQAAPLVAASPALAEAASAVHMQPCWATAVTFADRVVTRFDAAFVSNSPLGWIARDNSKPKRGLAETWILHATPTWSAAHFNDPSQAVSAFLLNAFGDLVPSRLPLPVHIAEHRWSLACANPPLSVGVLHDRERHLVVCGDWCAGNRIEGAFSSGVEAAEALDGG